MVTTPGGTARELLAGLRAGGMRQADIARALDVSPRMLRFVQAGQKPGTLYIDALSQLATRGRVETAPAHRTQRVRAPGGATVPKVSTRPPAPSRGAFGTRTTFVAGGKGRVVEVSAPRSEGKGRDAARAQVLAATRSAARGGRRVAFVVEYSDGTRATLGAKGGYRAGAALRRMQGATGPGGVIDPFEWLTDEVDGTRYAPGLGAVVVGLSVTVF